MSGIQNPIRSSFPVRCTSRLNVSFILEIFQKGWAFRPQPSYTTKRWDSCVGLFVIATDIDSTLRTRKSAVSPSVAIDQRRPRACRYPLGPLRKRSATITASTTRIMIHPSIPNPIIGIIPFILILHDNPSQDIGGSLVPVRGSPLLLR